MRFMATVEEEGHVSSSPCPMVSYPMNGSLQVYDITKKKKKLKLPRNTTRVSMIYNFPQTVSLRVSG